MPLDRREFMARLGAGAAAAAMVTSTAGAVIGAAPAGALNPPTTFSGGADDPYRERVVNGSFEDGPEGFPAAGWQGLD